jgi:nitroimidazol reductase NimA-like FMN-containing flavoprotein (pyridoxamine 5'-phosphate oxidase superfamily)
MTKTVTVAPTAKTRVRRDERAVYDRSFIHSVIDEALVCHVGFAIESQPFVIPMMHARVGDALYLHGSPAARMLRSMRSGSPVCVTFTLLDGLVLARSAFHHSMNFRSVVVMGAAREVTDAQEKLGAMRALIEHVAPGRWDECRRPSNKEFAKTLVLAVPIVEASAKVRTGPPVDDEPDRELDVWAGEIPLQITALPAIDDPLLRADIPRPEYKVPGAAQG